MGNGKTEDHDWNKTPITIRILLLLCGELPLLFYLRTYVWSHILIYYYS